MARKVSLGNNRTILPRLSRRDFLKVASVGSLGAAAAASVGLGKRPAGFSLAAKGHSHHSASATVGDVGPRAIGVDPSEFLTSFDYGRVSRLSGGQVLREYQLVALDREIEIAPGVFFPAWTYNGQVPGPTLRATHGDRVRVDFVNAGSHPHTIHFHGLHPPAMDGVAPVVEAGQSFRYEFEALPFGLHVYHCHAIPLKRHIHKGLYGTLIIDPPEGRAEAVELVMVMNAFDTNFDGDNEVYAVNSVAFHYQKHPIVVPVGKLIRVYLSNLTEFDPINSFHLHAGMFRLYRTGTRLDQYEYTDTVMLCQGERHILEFTLEYPGQYMFHAHQSEFAELGWMGFFEAVEDAAAFAQPAAGVTCRIG
jgi:FtsP/CotA-like multicopper oxidase with cupredoxin domain